ncbi:PLP-dependent aminotransferase family protein [Streptacidiphilus sp. ASG 303]|uniref:MocR-like transcription factor YczR n=1 Tax=Streptacidiphilus sp. ASG 303 TaxID=2896847 RepID=UPI001E56D7F6|nr:PLP-dependent aminotransferase family protein [Streptacidiphilus sp. ASG 303]MCD0481147.1 PLP-dependent aminotransferase family protein [Streptacidiphilus sp. ASG 303]
MHAWTTALGAARLARLLGGAGFPPADRTPAYRGLAASVRLLLLEGRLGVGVRLPAERELAAALGVSRTTVAAGYQQLRDWGYLASRRGSGSWTVLPDGHPVPTGALAPLPPDRAGAVLDLGCAALPAPEPWLTAAFTAALQDLPAHTRTHGDHPAGLPVLREALADRFTARGLPTTPEQVMVTTGAMGALDAVRRLLARSGDRVAVEAPSYANVLQMLRRDGLRLVPVALGEALSGWDPGEWRRVLRDAAPRAAYVIPDFHNPTGTLVPDDQRAALAAAARAAGTVLVADETMAELSFPDVDGDGDGEGSGRGGGAAPRPRPLAAHDPGGTVVTVGSASKAVWAGLRIGWVRAAPAVVRRLVADRAYADLGSPVLEQLAVARLLRDGGWDAALAERRLRLRAHRDAFAAALRDERPEWSFDLPPGGLTLWVRTAGLSGAALAAEGDRHGVRVAAGPRFGLDGAFEHYLRLPLTVGGDTVREAVRRLSRAADAVAAGAGADRPGEVFVA